MPKISLVTIISLFLNLFLTFWLVNQYLSDVYFQNYVNASIGQYYAFIVLTVGVGGGSGLGYLFLKRRHSDQSLVSKIQKSKSFKPVAPLSTSTTAATGTRAILPTGAPPSPASKHTVYAVPPLPKSTSPTSRSLPSTSWATASKSPSEQVPAPRVETPSRPSVTSLPSTREPTRPSPPIFSPPPQQAPSLSPPLRTVSEPQTRPPPPWTLPPVADRSTEPPTIFQKPGLDVTAKQGAAFPSFSSQPKSPEPSTVPAKWAPPQESKPGPDQWSDSGGVRSIPPLPTKWSPPTGTPSAQERPAPPSQQAIPRPGQLPPRGQVPPQQQSPPRPFGFPTPIRPGEQRPIAAPPSFRPNPARPPLGPAFQPRPPPPAPQPSPRPASSIGGPMPQPWTPPSEPTEKKESAPFGEQEGTIGRAGQEPKAAPEPGTGGGGEMDWDTALDTILKTLRKDRVGDTK